MNLNIRRNRCQVKITEEIDLPESLMELNLNSNVSGNMTYVPTYDKKLGHVGTTWVGAPYVELVTNNTDPECPYTFKLRFRESEETDKNQINTADKIDKSNATNVARTPISLNTRIPYLY